MESVAAETKTKDPEPLPMKTEAPRAPEPRASIVPKLQMGRLQERSNARRDWDAVPAGVSLEVIQASSYWTHFAAQLTPGDMIFAVREDGAWAAEFMVMFAENREVRLALYYFKSFEDSAGREAHEIYAIEWRGPGAKFCILNKATKLIVRDKLYPRAEAIAQLEALTRKMV